MCLPADLISNVYFFVIIDFSVLDIVLVYVSWLCIVNKCRIYVSLKKWLYLFLFVTCRLSDNKQHDLTGFCLGHGNEILSSPSSGFENLMRLFFHFSLFIIFIFPRTWYWQLIKFVKIFKIWYQNLVLMVWCYMNVL